MLAFSTRFSNLLLSSSFGTLKNIVTIFISSFNSFTKFSVPFTSMSLTIIFPAFIFSFNIFLDVPTFPPLFLFSLRNKKLCSKYGGKIQEDQFEHEQNLIVRENNKNVLFTGCSHNGIVNILDKYYENDKNHRIDMVIGGFHLFNPVSKKYESDVLINEIAKELSKQECMFYTCHCTGPKAYQKLKSVMNDKLEYLSTGTVLEIN